MCFLTISCSKQEHIPNSAFMDKLLVENPDSLANILEEINPKHLVENEKLDYTWWLANAHLAQNRSLINDSLIQEVLEYDKQTKSPRLYKTYELAIKQAPRAQQKEVILFDYLDLAQGKNDSTLVLDLCVRILTLWSKYGSGEGYKKKGRELDKIIINYSLKNLNTNSCYNLRSIYGNEPDSVKKYTLLGIDCAIKEKKADKEFDLTRSYVRILNQSGQFHKALQVLHDIEKKYPIGEGVIGNEINFDYIKTWIFMGQYDSAQICINNFTSQILNNYKFTEYSTEVYTTDLMFDIYRNIINVAKEGRVKSIVVSSSIDALIMDIRESKKIDAERMFIQNKLQRDKHQVEIEKQELKYYLLLGITIFIIVIALLLFLYQRKLLRKERSLQKMKDVLVSKSIEVNRNESIVSENEKQIESLNSQLVDNAGIKEELDLLITENENIKEKNKLLHNEILSLSEETFVKDTELDYIDTLSNQNSRLKENNQYLTIQLIRNTKILNDLESKPKYIEEPQWFEIIHTINQLFDNFSVRLHIENPILTDEDIRYCCLLKLRLTNSKISSLMGISPSSVTKRKQRIKEKINQQSPDKFNTEKSLDSYLWNYN